MFHAGGAAGSWGVGVEPSLFLQDLIHAHPPRRNREEARGFCCSRDFSKATGMECCECTAEVGLDRWQSVGPRSRLDSMAVSSCRAVWPKPRATVASKLVLQRLACDHQKSAQAGRNSGIVVRSEKGCECGGV